MQRLQAVIDRQSFISQGKMGAGQHSKGGHNGNLRDFCMGGRGEFVLPLYWLEDGRERGLLKRGPATRIAAPLSLAYTPA